MIKERLGFKELKSRGLHLGNSLILGRNKSKEFIKLKDRLQNLLEGWQRKILSKGSKATLIKSIAQAASVYTMQLSKCLARFVMIWML